MSVKCIPVTNPHPKSSSPGAPSEDDALLSAVSAAGTAAYLLIAVRVGPTKMQYSDLC